MMGVCYPGAVVTLKQSPDRQKPQLAKAVFTIPDKLSMVCKNDVSQLLFRESSKCTPSNAITKITYHLLNSEGC